MRILTKIVVICVMSLPLVTFAAAQKKTASAPKKVAALYPNLASGVLTFARLAQLPKGILMRAPNVELTIADVNEFIAKQPKEFHEKLKKNALYALEQQAGTKFLLELARKNLSTADRKKAAKNDRELINEYIDRITENLKVTEDDVRLFYEQHQAVFSGIPLQRIKKQLVPYALKDKKQRVLAGHLRTLGRRTTILVSAPWVKQQAVLARDNPLDKARESGKPTLAIFSSISCCHPEEILPIVSAIRDKYPELLNVLHFDAQQDQILAARYNVRLIPAQFFYDKSGKEVFRHFGFFSQQEIEKKLKDLGVK